jgi:predicted nucleotidyltransferase
MSVLSCLQALSRETQVSPQERTSIERSVANVRQKLGWHFGDGVADQYRFGSTSRGTNLPRALDECSDVDYMVVFTDNDKAPQTYLDRLRAFVETHFQRSEIRQSHPTIVLEFHHIKFDLVPAIKTFWSGLQIPDKDRSWQSTDPSGFNDKLSQRNSECGDCLKPAIRLVKRWNAANGYPFDSFQLEKLIVSNTYWTCNNLRDYVFAIFDKMSLDSVSQLDLGRIQRAQQRVQKIRGFEHQAAFQAAETEVRRLIA